MLLLQRISYIITGTMKLSHSPSIITVPFIRIIFSHLTQKVFLFINTGQAELADNAQGTGLSQIKATHYIHVTNYIVSQSMLAITNYKEV